MKHSYEEGFWWSDREPHLPFPMPNEDPFSVFDYDNFVMALTYLEKDPDTTNTAYRGWSNCRICGCMNGSVTYHRGDWSWPEGYAHYIKEHKVRPSLAFNIFISNEYMDCFKSSEDDY